MRPLALLLVLLVASPSTLWAQDPAPPPPPPPLVEQAITIIHEEIVLSRELTAPPAQPPRGEMAHPLLFWTGLVALAAGVVTAIAAVSWDRESDLSNEYRSIRLGTDLAPCGTDPASTRLPVAECKVNDELLWIGGGLAAVGGGMVVYGGRRTVAYTVKF